MKQIAYTEYAVEVMRKDKNGFPKFVRQIDVFKSYKEACQFTETYREPLNEDEYLNIIFIDYDEYGDEIAFGTVC